MTTSSRAARCDVVFCNYFLYVVPRCHLNEWRSMLPNLTNTMNLISNIKTKITTKMYTWKRLKRTAQVSFIAGVALTIFTAYYALPEATNRVNTFVERINPPATYAAPYQPEVGEAPVDTIERYYQEELTALEEKYQQLHEDAARLNAIERFENELEEQKQEIRGREILI